MLEELPQNKSIEMARDLVLKKVYFASAASRNSFPQTFYGIDMPSANELIAYGREIDEVQ